MLLRLHTIPAIAGVFGGSEAYDLMHLGRDEFQANTHYEVQRQFSDMEYYYYYNDRDIPFRVLLVTNVPANILERRDRFELGVQHDNHSWYMYALDITFFTPSEKAYRTYGIRTGQYAMMDLLTSGRLTGKLVSFYHDEEYAECQSYVQDVLAFTDNSNIIDYGTELINFDITGTPFVYKFNSEIPQMDMDSIEAALTCVEDITSTQRKDAVLSGLLSDMAYPLIMFGMSDEFISDLYSAGAYSFISNSGHVCNDGIYKAMDMDSSCVQRYATSDMCMIPDLERYFVLTYTSLYGVIDEMHVVATYEQHSDSWTVEVEAMSRLPVDIPSIINEIRQNFYTNISHIQEQHYGDDDILLTEIVFSKSESGILELYVFQGEQHPSCYFVIDPKYPYSTLFETIVDRDAYLEGM